MIKLRLSKPPKEPPITPDYDGELEDFERKEVAAMQSFKDSAKLAIKVIEENHFHLRLWQAVSGEEKKGSESAS